MTTHKNVLLILTDQQRKDSMGCYGNPYAHTPHLDRLAAQSVKFERCYVANPICMPNRMSIFTGRYPRSHGMWTNGLLLDRQPATAADWFAQAGYQTASIGKLHFAPYSAKADSGSLESADRWRSFSDDFDWNGPYCGFDHVELTIGHTNPIAHYGRWFRENGGTPEMLSRTPLSGIADTGARGLPEKLHDSTFIADRTIQYLKTQRQEDKPFFLVASFPDPHHPFDPPEETAARYRDKPVKEPVGSKQDLQTRPDHYQMHYEGRWHRKGEIEPDYPDEMTDTQIKERIRNTYAMVELIDQNIGRMLDSLEESGLAEDTVIVFTSDHGELLGDHGLWYKGPFFYEGLMNVPLLVSAKGTLGARVTNHLASSVDIFPTLCELAGISPPDDIDGLSLNRHLIEPDEVVRDRCIIEYRPGFGQTDTDSKAIVTDRWKLVQYGHGACELTDLKLDPEERQNRSCLPENQAVIESLRHQLLCEVILTENKKPEQLSHA
ncbi:sulfatase family protein [Marinicrinis sediminis]|uniref:Sulfatase n=1 Tax=Marinicrinis sediminis TaxID=1652465 RepID=A0ABW5R7F5_9BACL